MKNKNLTVGVFALGSAFKFKKKELKRSDGSLEYYNFIKLLARNPSIDKVVFLSRNNWSKITPQEKSEIDPRGVIDNPYDHLPLDVHKPPGSERDVNVQFNYLQEHTQILLNNYNIDFGVGFMSQGYYTVSTQPGFLNTVTKPYTPARCLAMCYYYASPIINFLNTSNIDWWMISTDPRYIKNKIHLRDTSNTPINIWGQYDLTVNWKHIARWERKCPDSIIEPIESRYAQVEKINIIGKDVIDPSNDRSTKLTVVAMQLSAMSVDKDERFDEIKKYLLHDKEIHIYGKWSEKLSSGNPQFKGFINSDQIDEIFTNTRYTLVLPTRFKWVTSKYSEMLQVGVVPFLHPDYDDQNHLVDANHFIRIKDPQDLIDKMNYLDNNSEERIKLVKELQQKLVLASKDGLFLIKEMNKDLSQKGYLLEETLDESNTNTYVKHAELF